MRPLSFSERVPGQTVSLAELMTGTTPPITGRSDLTLADYTEEILASGLPGVRRLPGRARRLQLDGYLERVVDRDIPDEAGVTIRNPAALRRWMAAYAAATATTTSFEKIRDAASPGQEHKPRQGRPCRPTATRWLACGGRRPVDPTRNPLSQLGHASKHQLTDPALAARLLAVDAPALLAGQSPGPAIPRDGTLLGGLFESLVGLSVRVTPRIAKRSYATCEPPEAGRKST